MAGVKPDIIVTWPVSCDYPLWRKFLHEERERFTQVIVSFSPTPGLQDCSHAVEEVLAPDDVTVLRTEWGQGWDWRDAAVNQALDISESEWVWFTEQDFFIEKPIGFWCAVEVDTEFWADAVGVRYDVRWHPCCLFVKREFIDKTTRYFGSDPVDHFFRFGEELEEAGASVTAISDWGESMYSHMAGLSHNHQLVERGDRVTYRPNEFARYLERCLALSDDELLGGWVVRAEQWLSGYYAER